MRGSLIAVTGCLALLCAGCGSGGSSAGSIKTACANATAAQKEYRRAGGRVGLNFLDPVRDRTMVAAIDEFRLRAEQLRGLSSGAKKEQLEELVSILYQHENLFKALAVHNLPEAHKYEKGLEPALEQSQARLTAICKKA